MEQLGRGVIKAADIERSIRIALGKISCRLSVKRTFRINDVKQRPA